MLSRLKQSIPFLRLSVALLRAAPINGVIFFTYEAVLRALDSK